MAQSVLGSLTLGYRPLWNRARALAGLRLVAHEDAHSVDGEHLLRTLGELWTSESPALLLSVQGRGLLANVVAHAEAAGPMLEIPAAWLDDARLRSAVRSARQRGVRMLASGPPGADLDMEAARCFERRSVRLSATDAAAALQAAARARAATAAGRMAGRADDSPVRPDALVDGVASRALAEHALDQQGAWAVAGWPSDDVAHAWRGQPIPPTRRAIVRVMNAIDEEQSLERIEHLFGQEPTLAYRLLLYLNSAGLGLPTGISSLRHGFMMLGFRKLNAWLAEQLPGASEDANLRPLNAALVVRGQLMGHLMEAGIEADLQREVYLCGLFSQLDLVLDEPLRNSFARIPLSERIVSAAISHTGPYAPALLIATALESGPPDRVRALRTAYDLSAEEVNRALLRTLASPD